jgi:hypothetical protein
VKERHINELGGDFVEGDEDAVAVVVGEGEAEELAVAVDVAGGEAGLVEEVGLGDEGDDESKSGEGNEADFEEKTQKMTRFCTGKTRKIMKVTVKRRRRGRSSFFHRGFSLVVFFGFRFGGRRQAELILRQAQDDGMLGEG